MEKLQNIENEFLMGSVASSWAFIWVKDTKGAPKRKLKIKERKVLEQKFEQKLVLTGRGRVLRILPLEGATTSSIFSVDLLNRSYYFGL